MCGLSKVRDEAEQGGPCIPVYYMRRVQRGPRPGRPGAASSDKTAQPIIGGVSGEAAAGPAAPRKVSYEHF